MGNHRQGSIRPKDVLLVCKHSYKINFLICGNTRNLLNGTLWQVGGVYYRVINMR